MNVHLIDYTGAGAEDPARHAANVLIFTKQTRLNMDPDQFMRVRNMTEEEVAEELAYMARTIPSSWEFVSYTFLITGVTRAFTHQLVRSRNGSYAQQTMRVLDVDGWEYSTGPTVEEDALREEVYRSVMKRIDRGYRELIESGAAIEDARGVLPTNIQTNIVAKFDLRAMTELARKRASSRTQGEYRAVLDGMKEEVMQVHPWTRLFFSRTLDTASSELEGILIGLRDAGKLSKEECTRAVKLIDEVRK